MQLFYAFGFTFYASDMIDSHAHVAFRQFNSDREAVIQRAREAGVRWLEVGTDVAQSRAAIALAEQYPDVVLGATVGVHPSDVGPATDPDGNLTAEPVGGPDGLTDDNWRVISDLLNNDRVVAVGEVGLDFYHAWPGFSAGDQAALQRQTLIRFIDAAHERNLPLIFHVRSGQGLDAHDELIALLTVLPDGMRPRGIIHTFSGNREQAQRYLELGLHLSFSGVVTYKNAVEMGAVAREVPLDRLLIETDCPFLTPDPHRGQRNEPHYVNLVAEKIAALRNLPVDEIAEASTRNAERLILSGNGSHTPG
jgi:TatD DNase family protein